MPLPPQWKPGAALKARLQLSWFARLEAYAAELVNIRVPVPEARPIRRLPAADIEDAAIEQVRRLLRTPEIVAGTSRAARGEDPSISEAEVRGALDQLDPLWEELFPAEQARILQLLVERVDVSTEGANIRLRVDGMQTLASGFRPNERVAT